MASENILETIQLEEITVVGSPIIGGTETGRYTTEDTDYKDVAIRLGRSRGTGDLGYDIAAFDMAAGIEPTSILCLGKMWRKTFPAQGRGERQTAALKAL